jgi:hypothetical protein
MNEYIVTWAVNLSADSPADAARKALEMQRDPDSLALVFDVYQEHAPSVLIRSERVDLMEAIVMGDPS